MNSRGIIVGLVWAGTLAFFGYLLINAILLVTPEAEAEAVKAFVENGRFAIVAFFGFLGGTVGLLQTLGAKTTDMESESDVDAEAPVDVVANGNVVDRAVVGKYKRKLRQTYHAAVELKRIARRNRHVGIKAMSYHVAINVALLFALWHIISAGLQGVLQRAFPPTGLDGALFFVVAFAQTIMLCLGAAIIPLYCYRRYLADTKYSSQSNSSGTVFRAGGLGIFAVGVASLATLSPEQISALLGNDSLRSLPVFHVNYMTYLAVLRLLLLPLIGIVACQMGRKFGSSHS